MKTVDFSETIAACDLKVGRCRQLIVIPGFVCFVLYLAKISGERLQDQWSSGSETIAASDLKARRSRHLIEYMKICEY